MTSTDSLPCGMCLSCTGQITASHHGGIMINRTVRYCSLTGKCVTPAVNSIFSYHKICLDFTFSVRLEFNTGGTPLTHTVNIRYIDVLCHHIHIHSSLLSDLNTFSVNLSSVFILLREVGLLSCGQPIKVEQMWPSCFWKKELTRTSLVRY